MRECLGKYSSLTLTRDCDKIENINADWHSKKISSLNTVSSQIIISTHFIWKIKPKYASLLFAVQFARSQQQYFEGQSDTFKSVPQQSCLKDNYEKNLRYYLNNFSNFYMFPFFIFNRRNDWQISVRNNRVQTLLIMDN